MISHTLSLVYHRADRKTRVTSSKIATRPGVRKSGGVPDLYKSTAKTAVFPCIQRKKTEGPTVESEESELIF